MTIAPAYAAVLAMLLITLSLRVIRARRTARVAIGDGGDGTLRRRMRVQANCAEYAPMGLILLGMAELAGAHMGVLHVLGLMLVAGRLVHAWGVSQEIENFRLRIFAMRLTFATLTAAAIVCLYLTVPGWFG